MDKRAAQPVQMPHEVWISFYKNAGDPAMTIERIARFRDKSHAEAFDAMMRTKCYETRVVFNPDFPA